MSKFTASNGVEIRVERTLAMIDQIDLTHTEEYYGELLLGAVVTRYKSDGEVHITTYDIRDVVGEPHSQITGAVNFSDAEARKLRDWLNRVLGEPEELFPGVNAALGRLTIRPEDSNDS